MEAKFNAQGNGSGQISAVIWTTTPWTLLGNVALVVGEKIDYVKIKSGSDILILAKARLSVIQEEYEILEEIKGKEAAEKISSAIFLK